MAQPWSTMGATSGSMKAAASSWSDAHSGRRAGPHSEGSTVPGASGAHDDTNLRR